MGPGPPDTTTAPPRGRVSETLRPGIPGFSYADLHDPVRLRDLARRFEEDLEREDAALCRRYRDYLRPAGESMPAVQSSALLVEVAPHLSRFVERLFQLQETAGEKRARARRELDTVFAFRREVARHLAERFRNDDVDTWNAALLERKLQRLTQVVAPGADDPEWQLCKTGMTLARLAGRLKEPPEKAAAATETAAIAAALRAAGTAPGTATDGAALFAAELEMQAPAALAEALLQCVERWCWLCLQRPRLLPRAANWVCLKTPRKTDFGTLVTHRRRRRDGYESWAAKPEDRRRRNGFGLTDRRCDLRQELYELERCLYCHDRAADSCSRGMRNRKTGDYRRNPLGNAIIGCPLEEKISEMQLLARRGDYIGALALIMVDNPMCPGTGHRICNDCMKGCIFQKSEPVNIPQVETFALTQVLFMPWGFEIYSLLARWNPLNRRRPYPLPYNGKNVLVVGMGPAGYTLAHYLLNEGFGVAGLDALKIEPLAPERTGTEGRPPQPLRDFRELYRPLDRRAMAGFGGVAEYGITARWDKNLLAVIHLTLARRRSFRCYGGVRFGGTLDIEDAWEFGFDHIALACGAGKPTIIGMENNLIRGIRKASDFLMALQLSGASRRNSLANLQIRLPAGVIGGGLTAIDTATEALAYYPEQVEKVLTRYQRLAADGMERQIRDAMDEEEREILDEFLSHARELRAERRRAQDEGRAPDLASLLRRWGGVTLYYRKRVQDSPAYRLNHEELREALREGIELSECLTPDQALADRWGALRAVRFRHTRQQDGKWQNSRETVEVPLKSLFIAAGTVPNTIYEQEYPYSFRMDRSSFQRYEPARNSAGGDDFLPMEDTPLPKVGRPAPFTSYCRDGRRITFYGDAHPVYAGSVVRAMASARDGYPYIVRLFERELRRLDPAAQPQRELQLRRLFARMDGQLQATVREVNRLTPTIVEVVVKAPMQARKFRPGQFYRVQNYETLAAAVEDTKLVSEGLALTGAAVDKKRGLISLVALEMGSSSRLCALWKPGDPLVVMGVTGQATELPAGRTVLLAGGGLGNAVQFSIGQSLRAAGARVLYFAGYRRGEDVFKPEEMEAAADIVVWTVDRGNAPIAKRRPQDKTAVGNIVEAMLAYGRGELGETPIRLQDVDHMIVIGSDRMMRAVKEARHGPLAPLLKESHTAIGSINSPMQCMMKGVCAQCLCRHTDPRTGEEYFVYSCYNQDQALDRVDFEHLNARLRQNSMQEKLSNFWLDRLLARGGGAGESA